MKCEKLPERGGPNDVPRCAAGKGRPRPPGSPGNGPAGPAGGGTGRPEGGGHASRHPAAPRGGSACSPAGGRGSCSRCAPPGLLCAPPLNPPLPGSPERIPGALRSPAPPLRRHPSNREGTPGHSCPDLRGRNCSRGVSSKGYPPRGRRGEPGGGSPGRQPRPTGRVLPPFPSHPSTSPPQESDGTLPPAFLPPKTQRHMRSPIDVRANK